MEVERENRIWGKLKAKWIVAVKKDHFLAKLMLEMTLTDLKIVKPPARN